MGTQTKGKVGKSFLAGQIVAAGGICRKILKVNKVLTPCPPLLAVTLVKVTGWKDPEKSQE